MAHPRLAHVWGRQGNWGGGGNGWAAARHAPRTRGEGCYARHWVAVRRLLQYATTTQQFHDAQIYMETACHRPSLVLWGQLGRYFHPK
jgi:hypothetical protein